MQRNIGSFDKVPSDQVIEQIINKDKNGSEGEYSTMMDLLNDIVSRLLCAFQQSLERLLLLQQNLFIKLLTKPKRIFGFIQHLLDANYCYALAKYHVVAGCDCTSLFHSHGKTKGLKLLEGNLWFQVKVHCLLAK